jgi:hypothetical protein
MTTYDFVQTDNHEYQLEPNYYRHTRWPLQALMVLTSLFLICIVTKVLIATLLLY